MSLDGAYWRRHAREAVAFASGVKSMADEGVDLVIEMGPHSVLGPMATLAWPDTAGWIRRRRWQVFGVRLGARRRLILRRVLSMRWRRRTKCGIGDFVRGFVRRRESASDFAAELSVPA